MREHAASSPVGGNLWGLVSRNLLIGGQPGSGKSVPLILMAAHAALTDERPEAEHTAVSGTCLACPVGCAECSTDESTCECYEHAALHPDDRPANGAEVV